MVVRTRSSYTAATATVTAAAPVAATTDSLRRSKRRRVTTTSFLEASTRPCKIYTPHPRTRVRGRVLQDNEPEICFENETSDAAEVLVSMPHEEARDDHKKRGGAVSPHQSCCLNPMTPITKYIYKISVYNLDQTTHYNTSYIIYNYKTRQYNIFSIVSTMIQGGGDGGDGASEPMLSFPIPTNTIQFKYVTYVNAGTYVMNIIAPADQRDYYMLTDFIGVIGNIDLDDETSFYDIDHIWNSNDLLETRTGHRMFILAPTRVYYWDAGCDSGSISSNCKYTTTDINTALEIITNVK
jgi:hypothetical protein